MRVIAGIYRSRPLVAPRGMATRPTSDRLRETLFDVMGPRVVGARFADLFAGSGAVGIEALSRGAAHVLFIENSASTIEVIRHNLRSLGIVSGFTLERRLLPAALYSRRGASEAGEHEREGVFDVVFLDPPYKAADACESTLEALGWPGLVADQGVVVVEHRRFRKAQGGGTAEKVLKTAYGCLRQYRVLDQGDAALSFYQPVGHEEQKR